MKIERAKIRYPLQKRYWRCIKKVAKNYNLEPEVKMQWPYCKVTYNGEYIFYIELNFHLISQRKRCIFNAEKYLNIIDT